MYLGIGLERECVGFSICMVCDGYILYCDGGKLDG